MLLPFVTLVSHELGSNDVAHSIHIRQDINVTLLGHHRKDFLIGSDPFWAKD